ncbi:MAG: 3-hydroxyacyl-ACP dehydratase FabZ [Moorellales bacterium]
MDAPEIMALLPHRYPFLLVDRILVLEPGKRAVGIKNVSLNEPVFQGHFPGQPVWPGVLILEALAQTGAVALLALPEYRGKIPYFGGIDRARFRRPVLPGDQLRLEVELLRVRGTAGKGQGRAWVEEEAVAEAEFLFVIR